MTLQLLAAGIVGVVAIGFAWISGSDHMRIRGDSGWLSAFSVVLMLCALFVAHGWPL